MALLFSRYPIEKTRILFAMVICLTIPDALCVRQSKWKTVLIHTVFCMIMAAVFFLCADHTEAWKLLAGFVLCGAISAWVQINCDSHEKSNPDVDAETIREVYQKLRSANVYRVFEKLSAIGIVAVYLSLVMLFVMLARSADQCLPALAFLVCGAGAYAFLQWKNKRSKRTADATLLLLSGIFFWVLGLFLCCQRPQVIYVVGCGICAMSVTVSLTALNSMENSVAKAVRFVAGPADDACRQIREASRKVSILIGQTCSLLTLLILVLTEGLEQNATVLLTLPILAVLAALFFALRYPISSRYDKKMDRFLYLEESGEKNSALNRRLESVLIQKFRQPFAIRTLKGIIHRCYPHRLLGTENLREDDTNPMVFLCNHAELYGPVVSYCDIPVPVRPWVISMISVDLDETTEYLHRYDTSRIRWLPEKAQRWLARQLGRISIWGMRQLESVPVYRDKPGQLMKTFRASVEAMECGDNLLIFPENPNAAYQDHGYEHGTIGELFSGFAMLGQIYHSRTGKDCRFIPMVCHKDTRTITFGPEIVYNADADPAEERQRVSDECARTMRQIWNEMNERSRKAKKGVSGRGT